MIGHKFRVNEDFFNTAKDENNKPLGRTKIAENTTITVVDTQIRNGVRWCKLDILSAGSVGRTEFGTNLILCERRQNP